MPTTSPPPEVNIFTYIPPAITPILRLLAVLREWNVWIIPAMVPRNPIMGATPAMMDRMLVFFSSLKTSSLPTFSMECSMSARGFPMRISPFSTMRATGESVL
jgi:hypothetical protein